MNSSLQNPKKMRTSLNTHCGPVTVGTRIRIIRLNNGDSPIKDKDYNGREGIVTHFDEVPDEHNPGMHGTWGGLAVYDTDKFEIIQPQNNANQ